MIRISHLLTLTTLFYSTTIRGAELVVPDEVLFERGVEYANPDDQHLQLNLARPKTGSGPFPVVLCIHGGGFRAGTREGYDKLCLSLGQHGFVAATITYRLAPKYPFPAAVHDTKAAVRWLRANAAKYNLDPKRIGVTGGSAGGHLAQFLGVTEHVPEFEGDQNPGFSDTVACVVNLYGPSDFTKSYGKSVDAHEVLPLWLGGNLEQARLRHIQSSPLNWVTPRAAPTLLIHGTEDKYVAYGVAIGGLVHDSVATRIHESRQLKNRTTAPSTVKLGIGARTALSARKFGLAPEPRGQVCPRSYLSQRILLFARRLQV